MKQLISVLVFAALPVSAIAETQLERLERVSEQMNDAMYEAMIRMVERQGGDPAPLRDAMPASTWDEDFRAAGACMLDRFTDKSSPEAVTQMLDEMEAFLPEVATMDLENAEEDMNFLPDGISEDYSIQVNSECGLSEIMMQRMQESGFSAAMMQAMRGN